MKTICKIIILSLCIVFVSWGQLGHKTIAVIAERHLNVKAKQSLQKLLPNVSLSDIANWADEVRRSSEYRSTGPWHYINLPVGLQKNEFVKLVTSMSEPNVYRALIDEEQKLSSTSASRDEKIEALKFIVHFTGDVHQPMHVSRAEDQGGNKIQVNYDNKGTNLHALWDSRLIEHEGLSEQELANNIDKATTQQIAQWQRDPLIDWMWESYQISSTLYNEVDAMPKKIITDQYYQSHLPIIEQRLEKAGIRLAGVLNAIFAKAPILASNNSPSLNQPQRQDGDFTAVGLFDLVNHVGEVVKVCGKVYGEKAFSGMTLLNVGADYPNQLLTIVLKGDAKDKWQSGYTGNVCVKGTIVRYKGKPEIAISSVSDISK
jgi:hypothetical protein